MPVAVPNALQAIAYAPASVLSRKVSAVNPQASQRSGHVKRRKVIWEALHPAPPQRFESVWDALGVSEGRMTKDEEREGEQVRQLVAPVDIAKHGRTQEKEFAASTAALTGENVRSIQRHVARADALGDDLPRITGTSLDKGVELDALARHCQTAIVTSASTASTASMGSSAPTPASACLSW